MKENLKRDLGTAITVFNILLFFVPGLYVLINLNRIDKILKTGIFPVNNPWDVNKIIVLILACFLTPLLNFYIFRKFSSKYISGDPNFLKRTELLIYGIFILSPISIRIFYPEYFDLNLAINRYIESTYSEKLLLRVSYFKESPLWNEFIIYSLLPYLSLILLCRYFKNRKYLLCLITFIVSTCIIGYFNVFIQSQKLNINFFVMTAVIMAIILLLQNIGLKKGIRKYINLKNGFFLILFLAALYSLYQVYLLSQGESTEKNLLDILAESGTRFVRYIPYYVEYYQQHDHPFSLPFQATITGVAPENPHIAVYKIVYSSADDSAGVASLASCAWLFEYIQYSYWGFLVYPLKLVGFLYFVTKAFRWIKIDYSLAFVFYLFFFTRLITRDFIYVLLGPQSGVFYLLIITLIIAALGKSKFLIIKWAK